MSLFGKLLAIFNVLAAIAFVSVAILDWSKRQSWETAVYRQGLVIDGLPLDGDERDQDGRKVTELITEATKKDVFSGNAGTPVATQMEELDRVQKAVIASTATAPPADQARILLPFSTTSTEFEQFARIAAGDQNLAAVISALPTKLASVFTGPTTGSIDERKLAIARVLVNLIGVESTLNLQRVLAVCGMVNTVRALETQTQITRKMTDDLSYAIDRDRSEFVVKQNRALNQARDRADELRTQRRALAAQQDLVERQSQLVKGLEKEIDQALPPSANQPLPLGLKQRLAAAQDAVKNNLEIQAKMEESLFNARKQLRDLEEDNRKLEQQLREPKEKAKSR